MRNGTAKRKDMLMMTMRAFGSDEALCNAIEGRHGLAAQMRCARNHLDRQAALSHFNDARLLMCGVAWVHTWWACYLLGLCCQPGEPCCCCVAATGLSKYET